MKWIRYIAIGLVLLTIALTAHSALGNTAFSDFAKPTIIQRTLVMSTAVGVVTTATAEQTSTPSPIPTRLPRATATATEPFSELPGADGAELFARIVYNSTQARVLPDAGSSDLMTVYYNDIFPIVDQVGTGNNLWFQVILPDGRRAWVWVNAIELLTVEGERAVAATPTPNLNPFTSTPTIVRDPFALTATTFMFQLSYTPQVGDPVGQPTVDFEVTSTAVFNTLNAIAGTQTALAPPTLTPTIRPTLPPSPTASATEPFSSLPYAEDAEYFVRVIYNSTSARLGPYETFSVIASLRFNHYYPVVDQLSLFGVVWFFIILPDGRSAWVIGSDVELLTVDGERAAIPTSTPTLTRTASATATASRTRTPTPTPTQIGAEAVFTIRVTAPSVNVRSGPGTEFDIVTAALLDQEFPVIGQSGTGAELWYQVELPDGRSGWIWGNLVTPIVSEPTTTVKATNAPTIRPTRRPSATPTEEFDIVVLSYGESVEEVIDSSDADYYVIFGNEGDTVELTMESDHFYPVLGLFDVDMNEIDVIWGWDTRDHSISLEYMFEDDGVYFIGVGADSYNDRGGYTLSVDRVIGK